MTTPQEKRLGVGLFIEEYLEKIIHGGQVWYNRDAFLRLTERFNRSLGSVALAGSQLMVAHNVEMRCQTKLPEIEDFLRMMYRDDNQQVFLRLPDDFTEDDIPKLQSTFEAAMKLPTFQVAIVGYPAFIDVVGHRIPVAHNQYEYREHTNIRPYPSEQVYRSQAMSLLVETSTLDEKFVLTAIDRFASEMNTSILTGRAWERTY